jgi:2-methylcitrate dehydratase PrpD
MSSPREQAVQAMAALVDWAAGCPQGAIPADVLRKAAHVLADDLAAVVGARDEPEVRAFHDRTTRQPGRAEATIFRGGRTRVDRLSAAVANAVAADWLELDEGYRRVPCHAGLYVLPSLWAEAEARNLRCDELLRALVLAYELTTRVARAWRLPSEAVQPHGRFGAIGAAAGVALARRHAAPMVRSALGTAATLSKLSPRSHLAEGVLARNVWPAAGAWEGAMSVEWAECGIEGSLHAFHDAYVGLLGASQDVHALTEGLGTQWAILDGYTKISACCQHLHSAVEAAQDLHRELMGDEHARIESVVVETHRLALALQDRAPRTTLGAQFSLPHAVAATLIRGAAGPEAFGSASLQDERIAALRDQVQVMAFEPALPPPHDRPARVRVRLADGRVLTRECLSAAGGPDRPLPAGTVLDKVERLAGPVYPEMRAVLESLCALEPQRLAQGWGDTVEEICKR